MAKGADKKQAQQQQTASWENLNKVFNVGTDTAKTAGKKGFGFQDQAANYFKTILGGDRNALMDAVSPQANMIRDTADARKRELAETGTARSGGAVAASQQMDTDVMKQIDSLVAGLGPNAAAALSEMGSEDIGAMLNALGVATGAAGNLGQQSTGYLNQKNASSSAMWGSLIKGIASVGAVALAPATGGASLLAVPALNDGGRG